VRQKHGINNQIKLIKSNKTRDKQEDQIMLTYRRVDESNPLGNLLHSSISANDKRNPFLYAYLLSLFHEKPQTQHIIYMKQLIRILPFVFNFFFSLSHKPNTYTT